MAIAQQAMTVQNVQQVVEEVVAGRPDIGVFLSLYGDGGGGARNAVLELTRLSHEVCDQCGQGLSLLHPGPVAWIDQRTGDVQGGFSHQHGCGQWNAPEAVSDELVLIEPNEAEEHPLVGRAMARQRLARAVETLLDRLDRQVAEDVAEREAKLRASLREQLWFAVRELAAAIAAEQDEEQRGKADVAARPYAYQQAEVVNARVDEQVAAVRQRFGTRIAAARDGAIASDTAAGDLELERDALVASLEAQRRSGEDLYEPLERRSDQELMEEVCTGSQFEPGVYVDDDGRLAAWAPNVLLDLDQESEGIRVTQDDLTDVVDARDEHEQPDSEPSAEQERAWDEQYDGTSFGA